MKRFKSIVLAALAVFLVAAYLQTPSASAQSSSALSIAPKKNYLIEPGKSVNDKLVIRNLDGQQDLKLYMRVIDFSYTDETGTPKLMLEEDEPTTWSLRPYMKVPETVTVRPNSSASVDMSVKMPANIGAGSYYSAIIYSTTAPDGGNVGLAASGVTLAFVTVPGDMTEDLTLKSFGAYNPTAKKYMNFTVNEPKVIAYTLENKGNVTEAPVGTITLKNWFGQEYRIEDVNPSKSLALIGQTRTFQACIKLASADGNFKGTEAEGNTCVDPGLWPGYYSANLDIFYGQNGNLTKEITKSGYFWYMPWWFLALVIIVVLALAYLIWRTIVMLRGGSFKIGGRPRTKSRRRR